MNNVENGQLLQEVIAHWPHSAPRLGAESLVMWKKELDDVPFEVASAAITVMAREGREHAPGPGLVRRKAVELMIDAPPWAAVLKAIRRVGRTGVYSVVYGAEEWRKERARVILSDYQPIVSAFVMALGYRQIAENLEQGGNGEARLRTKWTEYVKDCTDSGALAGLPAPPSLARIARASSEVLPVGEVVRGALEAVGHDVA